jgi:hypothetical protein
MGQNSRLCLEFLWYVIFIEPPPLFPFSLALMSGGCRRIGPHHHEGARAILGLRLR